MAVVAGSTVYEAGNVVGAGSFLCLDCGFGVALAALDSVPTCPSCDGRRFRRASMFEQPTVDEDAIEFDRGDEDPYWLQDLRQDDELEGQFLCFEDDAGICVVPVPQGWTRIGRSATADIQLDDPTVSRRHALIVRTESGELRVLDDRSLNGVFVNGERTEWMPISDGDELEVGRYRLYLLDTAATPSRAKAPTE